MDKHNATLWGIIRESYLKWSEILQRFRTFCKSDALLFCKYAMAQYFTSTSYLYNEPSHFASESYLIQHLALSLFHSTPLNLLRTLPRTFLCSFEVPFRHPFR